MDDVPRTSRLRRFVDVYGWRAYAAGVLTVVTLVALVVLVLTMDARG